MPEPSPFGLTFFEPIMRAMLRASLVNVSGGGKVETVFTSRTHFFLATVKAGASKLGRSVITVVAGAIIVPCGVEYAGGWLCLGGTTAVFSVIDAIVLRGLPYRNADRLQNIYEHSETGNIPSIRDEDVACARVQRAAARR